MSPGFIARTSTSNFSWLDIRLAAALAAALATLSLTGCGNDVESQLAEIRSLQSAGQYEPSIASLRKVLATESSHPEANFRLGVALVRTSRPSLAIWPLQKASQSSEYGIQAGIVLANTLLAQDAFEDSIRASTKVLEKDAENLQALFSRARANLLAGTPEGTLKDAQRVLELRPDDPTANGLLGAALIDLDRGSEAEATFIRFAEEAEKTGDENQAGRTCAQLGTFYRSQQDDEKATEVYEKCLEKYPAHPLLRQLVSDFYVGMSKPDKAIEIWRQAVETTPEDLNLRSKLADLLYGKGDTEEAMAVVQESVELFDTPQAWRMLSAYERRSGDAESSRKALESALERTRKSSPAMQFALADLLIAEGNYDRAEEIAAKLEQPAYRHILRGAILLATGNAKGALEKFDSGLRIWPNNGGARYLAGLAANEVGDRDRALKEFREAIRIDESETDAALRLAEIHFQAGQYKPALSFAERHIKSRPYSGPNAHRIASRSATAMGAYDLAENVLKNLKVHDMTSAVPSVEFAHVKREQSGPAAAIEVVLRSGLDLTDPVNAEALRSLSSDFMTLGKPEEALRHIDAALAGHDDSAQLWNLKAHLLLSSGDQARADKALDKALSLDPALASALQLRGTIVATQGKPEEAIKYYRMAAEAEPNEAGHPYLIAQARLQQADTKAAIEALNAALEADPSHVGANNDLAWLLAAEGTDLDRALGLARTAVRIGAGADTLDTLGFVHLQQGNAGDAATVFAKALEERPDSPSIGYRLGVALAAKGKREEARAALTKALETPSFPEADAARTELAKLTDS